MNSVLIVGASSAIAKALTKALESDHHVIAVSQHSPPSTAAAEWHQTDYSEDSIASLCEKFHNRKLTFELVFICNGMLHREVLQPEKRLENFDPRHLDEVMQVNTVIPTLWLKHLKRVVKGNAPAVVTVFSARVGSIGDNGLGGWYSYRASKAALNMLIKSASIEYARIAKSTRFLIFHPGTVDSPLSKPFQKSVPEDKLFTPEFVAAQLVQLVAALPREPGVDYMDWNHQIIPW